MVFENAETHNSILGDLVDPEYIASRLSTLAPLTPPHSPPLSILASPERSMFNDNGTLDGRADDFSRISSASVVASDKASENSDRDATLTKEAKMALRKINQAYNFAGTTSMGKSESVVNHDESKSWKRCRPTIADLSELTTMQQRKSIFGSENNQADNRGRLQCKTPDKPEASSSFLSWSLSSSADHTPQRSVSTPMSGPHLHDATAPLRLAQTYSTPHFHRQAFEYSIDPDVALEQYIARRSVDIDGICSYEQWRSYRRFYKLHALDGVFIDARR
jgi:hypothetical protein